MALANALNLDANTTIPGNISGNSGTVTINAAMTGDVNSDGTTNATTISSGVVTYAKIQNVNASKLLGNPTASVGPASEITIGSGLILSTDGVLRSSASGAVNVITNTTGSALNLTTADFGKSYEITTSGTVSFTINLPTTATSNGALNFYVNSSSINYVQITIQANSGQTINNYYTQCIIGPGESVTLIADGSNYVISSQNLINIVSVAGISTSSITIPISSTNIAIPFDSKIMDISNFYNTSSYSFFPKYYGLYAFSSRITYSNYETSTNFIFLGNSLGTTIQIGTPSGAHGNGQVIPAMIVDTFLALNGSTDQIYLSTTGPSSSNPYRIQGNASVNPSYFQMRRQTNLVS